MSPPADSNTAKRLEVSPRSRLPGFHKLNPAARREALRDAGWSLESASCGLDDELADTMVENAIGVHALPLAVGLNFRLDGEDRVLPMAVEEPSIVAACSMAAKLTLELGGFTGEADPPLLAAQVQLCDVPREADVEALLRARREELLALANRCLTNLVARGGGARDLEVRNLEPGMWVVHVLVDCRDAMGANLVNSVAEWVAPVLAEWTGGRYGLRILSNLTDRRRVTVRCAVPAAALASERWPDGARVLDRIAGAQRFAELDPYRAATHNKGVMNGVDAVLLACGNDWRAVEAGAHAYAARGGGYRPLTAWRRGPRGELQGELTMPLAASIVGGAARNHPGVRRALALAAVRSSTDLALLAACAGLAANLAALKALSTDGIQQGHMALHARRVAHEAGARGAEVDEIAAALSAEKNFRPERALQLVRERRDAP